MYTLRATAAPLGAADPEPNGDPATAIAFDTSAGVTGRLGHAGDVDVYRLSIDASLAARQLDLRLLSRRLDIARELCLLDADGNRLQCRRAEGPLSLPSLFLSPADYYVSVAGDPDPDAPYVLRLEPTTTPVPDFELEPNDSTAAATSVAAGTEMRGWATPGDDDYYRVTVGGDPQLWEMEVSGGGIDLLAWVQGDGTALASGTVSADRTTPPSRTCTSNPVSTGSASPGVAASTGWT